MRRLVALLASALVLAACGSPTSGPVTTASPSIAPTVSAAPDTTAVPVVTTTSTTIGVADTAAAPVAQPVVPTAAAAATVRSITIGGMGAEYAEPVRCVVDLGVTSRRPTVKEAGQAAAAAAAALRDALTAGGVAAADIQTTDFSVSPYYNNYPYIEGFETNIGYRVALPDVDEIGSVLAGAMAAGGDDVRASGVRFEADAAALIEGARAKAWADAVGRAESLAALAGEPLGEVLDVHEKVLVTSNQGMAQGGEGDSASFDIPISPGVSGVVVLLTVTFALGE